MVVAAGFEGFEITWRKDVFSGAPQAGSAASFGTLGINFRAHKSMDAEGSDATSTQETPAQEVPSQTTENGGSPRGDAIGAMTLREMLERGDPVTVIDVRKAEDRVEWAIPGSVHFDAYDALNAGDAHVMEGLDLSGDIPMVTVCGAGKTSLIAADQLRRQGYAASSLEGGLKAWSLAWNIADVPTRVSGTQVVQIRRTGKGCLSYLVGSGGEAAVIDASVDPEVYVNLARARGWKIARVLDTHVHADHISRSRRLAQAVGAELRVPEGALVYYPHSPIADGDTVEIGSSQLTAIRTPGHTAESTSYLLDGDAPNGGALFTGDTLFLTTVGRPDLEATPEGAREKGRALFGSVRHLLDLDPETIVLPGHTAEPAPFDGKPISAPLSEVREEVGPLLENENRFVEKVAGRAAPTPENYQRIVKLNRSGERPEGDPTELEVGANRCAAG